MTPTAGGVADTAPAREADDVREIVFVLLFGLLAISSLLLVRHVRMGFPGDIATPTRVAVAGGATAHSDWDTQAQVSEVRQGAGAFPGDRSRPSPPDDSTGRTQ